MTAAKFITRDELGDFQWDNVKKDWRRPTVDGKVLKELSERSTADGVFRLLYFMLLLAVCAVGAVYLRRIHILLAIPAVYAYYFLYGFWVAIVHELQHRTIFGKHATVLNEVTLFFVQVIMWNCPRYARIAHRLHHRYTMIRGMDPEQDWPDVITSKWLRGHLFYLISRILIFGSVYQFVVDVWLQVKRVLGIKDWVMRDHCTKKDIRAIQLQSLAILLIHAAIVAVAIIFRKWELIVFFTVAWQIGAGIELIWHQTEHIGRPYNVNDHRLNTRSVKVSWFIHTIFWGLDDHVEHHLYPIVPSRNLPKLRKLIKDDLPEPKTVIGNWREMFEIARRKDQDEKTEFVCVELNPGSGVRDENQPEDSW